MKLSWDTSIENWMDNVLSIGSLDFVNMKTFNHGYNLNKNEYFYWINLGRFKIRWWRNTDKEKGSGGTQ